MNSIKDCSKGLYTLLLIAPLFWLIPTLVEGLQHYVEVQLGMFTVGDSVEAGSETAIRLAFGFLKVISILITALLILKLAANDWDKSKLFPLNRFEKLAILLVSLTILAALIFVTYFGSAFTTWLSDKIQIPSSIAPFVPLAVIVIPMLAFRQQLMKGLLKLSGININGKLSSKSYLLELLYIVFPVLLLAAPMILHYKINDWAKPTEGWELFGWLAADSLLVGFMALLMGLSLRLAVTSVYSKELTQQQA